MVTPIKSVHFNQSQLFFILFFHWCNNDKNTALQKKAALCQSLLNIIRILHEQCTNKIKVSEAQTKLYVCRKQISAYQHQNLTGTRGLTEREYVLHIANISTEPFNSAETKHLSVIKIPKQSCCMTHRLWYLTWTEWVSMSERTKSKSWPLMRSKQAIQAKQNLYKPSGLKESSLLEHYSATSVYDPASTLTSITYLCSRNLLTLN